MIGEFCPKVFALRAVPGRVPRRHLSADISAGIVIICVFWVAASQDLPVRKLWQLPSCCNIFNYLAALARIRAEQGTSSLALVRGSILRGLNELAAILAD
jgi:hypothetical protein